MSTTATVRTQQNALHAKYQDATYDVGRVGRYFTNVEEAWQPLVTLAIYRSGYVPYTVPPESYQMLSEMGTSRTIRALTLPGYLEGEIEEVVDVLISIDVSRPLRFERIQLNSPIEITLAAAGSTGVALYALHLLSAVLRDPERIGAWLPRLATGWHRGWREARLARHGHVEFEGEIEGKEPPTQKAHTEALVQAAVSKLLSLSGELQDLHSEHVAITGGSEVPADIAEALEALDQWD